MALFRKQELLTKKDKAKLKCMVREHGKLYTIAYVGRLNLLDEATEQAARKYVKSL